MVALEEEQLAELLNRFSERSCEELRRFCRARPQSVEAASKMFQEHLDWRKGKGSPENLAAAYDAIPEKYVRFCGTANDGTALMLVQGARYEPTIEAELYVLACAHILDAIASLDDKLKVTVLVDVRPVDGCPNVPAHNMIPFFRLATSILPDNFPERAHKLIVYNMPPLVSWLWRVVRSFLDATTQDKFVFLSGSDSMGAACSVELRKYVSLEELPIDARSSHQALVADGDEVDDRLDFMMPLAQSIREDVLVN